MIFEERAEAIMEMLNRNGSVSVDQLSGLFGISAVSVRKDLSRMEEEGKLRRTFGGAVLRSFRPEEEQRFSNMERIASRTALEVKDGDSVIINAGNTTLFTARALMKHHDITVITNSVTIAREMSSNSDIQLIFLGGEIDADAVFTYGMDAIAQLKQYKADKLILSISGISCARGLTTRHMSAADLLTAMIGRARETMVVADDTKLGFESFYHVGDLHSVDKIITNTCDKSEEELNRMEKSGIEIIRC